MFLCEQIFKRMPRNGGAMETEMEDRYSSFEVIDEKTKGFAAKETGRFRKKFSQDSRKNLDEIRKLSGFRRIGQVKIRDGHTLLLVADSKGYSLYRNGKVIYRTKNIIFWIEAGNEAKKIALYETSGSDLGTLVFMENGEIKDKIQDYIGGITFTENSYIMVREYRGDQIPENIERNSSRAVMNGKIVFGNNLKRDNDIKIRDFQGTCVVVTGNELHSDIYVGRTDEPETWKHKFSFEHEAQIMGMVDGKVCMHLREGKGKILLDNHELFESPYPLEKALLVKDGILLITMRDAKVFPMLYGLDGNIKREMELNEPCGLVDADSDGNMAILSLQSFSCPMIHYEYSDGSLRETIRYSSGKVDVKEDYADSHGVKVHYFHISGEKSRHNRALVYGYGGFNISMTPVYYPLFAFLVKRGVDVIYCNLRGGGEYGEEWHKAGMKENKINVFNDFKAVVMKIRSEGYRIVIWGVSNGGLLTSHALVTIPEMLNGAVIGNPVIDMMKYHKLLAGSYWINEYGDPDDPEERKFLLAYSPYHARPRTRYPPALIYTRMNDDRVHPAHALKFYAKIKESGSEVYLRADPSGGHIGLSFAKRTRETSDLAAFILYCFGKSF